MEESLQLRPTYCGPQNDTRQLTAVTGVWTGILAAVQSLSSQQSPVRCDCLPVHQRT